MISRKQKQQAGHYEILGETLAKFEFFEAGWNPYQRYLDTDKVDFILRKRIDQNVTYREVQVKYGKLYDCKAKWEVPLFKSTSWRFFKQDEFKEYENRRDFFLVYVLAHDTGYNKDIFIFPIKDFHNLLMKAVATGDKKRVLISQSATDNNRWYFRIKAKFDVISSENCIEVTKYRRAFDCLI